MPPCDRQREGANPRTGLRLPPPSLLLLLLLLILPPLQASTAAAERKVLTGRSAGVAVWFDEKNFKEGEIVLVRRAFEAAGAKHAGGAAKHSDEAKVLGYQVPDRWDVLWTVPTPAKHAAPFLAAWQMMNAVPGLVSISKKDKLAETMVAAYGEDAYRFIPPSFLLPRDMDGWRAWHDPDCPQGREEKCLWVLKTNKHLGKGLKILPRAEAEEQAATSKFPVAQKYIANPMLIDGRKFGIRLWAVLTSTTPLRAYLHDRGLVLFSSNTYDMGREHVSMDGTSGHLTNAFQNAEGHVWTLQELQEHLGAPAFSALWAQLAEISGMALAAALAGCRLAALDLGLRPGSTFQLLGLDFLLDANHKPWLIEVNSTPSMSLHGADKVGTDKLEAEKGAMLGDLVGLLGIHTLAGGTAPATCAWGDAPGDCRDTGAAELLPELREVLASAAELSRGSVEGRSPAPGSVPPELQGALCQPPGWRSPGSAEDTPRGAAACARCLSQEDLQLLVELEAELARRGAFQPLTQDFHSFCMGDAPQRQWSLPCARQDQLAALWLRARAAELERPAPERGSEISPVARMLLAIACR